MRKQLIKTKFNIEFLIWFAGFFDGEGAFRIKRHSLSKNGHMSIHIHLAISNTHRGSLEYIAKNLGGRIKTLKRRNPKHKTLYRWYSSSTDSVQIITSSMLPYLIVKKERAKLILKFEKRDHLIGQGSADASPEWKRKKKANDRIYEKQVKLMMKMRELNMRGPKL